ncbi:MAG: hypothetical protein QNJ46_36090, partial [Leptolyngbyaceae cyanobacterium MO_188.B28]|nr:hypothetical protein [Leptolyngbyaceae cyanobacterium MO_188.B28]
MSDAQPPSPKDPDSSTQIRQEIEGNKNQTIGQVLGGIVVYVSGGQAIFNPASGQLKTEESKPQKSDIGPNPYKGLLAFQETDGDRFFGRDTQIRQLWEKFRSLHEVDSAVRLLPVYGPSGS